jgi:hypothetical protein
MIMMKQGAHQIKSDKVIVPIPDSAHSNDPRIVLLVKDIENEDPIAGSVSIPRSIFLEGELNKTYSMWITLFDDQGDDEYDGAMGVQDEESPRILLDFTVSEVSAPKKEIAKPTNVG